MKVFLIVAYSCLTTLAISQGFNCDGSMYIIVYAQSEGLSILYAAQEEDHVITYERILLSENRRLTGLSYNVSDEHLYALDNDSYEVVKINNQGIISVVGVLPESDHRYTFKSGTFSPNGTGMFLIRHNDSLDTDDRFYNIDIDDQGIVSDYIDITSDRSFEISDFAVDPITSTLYGYENVGGRLVQMGVGGQIAGLNFMETGVNDMDGLFFNLSGDLFGYSAKSGFYFIDLITGDIEFLSRGPTGTLGDACSCPYTYSFEKRIIPKTILPCEEFEIEYTFHNRMGIQQSFKNIADTLPEGFEILDFESQVAFNQNIVPGPPHIMSFDKVSFLMKKSEIRLKVRAPSDTEGLFKSRAVLWNVPFAFGEYIYSDDPETFEPIDATQAIVISQDSVVFDDDVTYSCDGLSATISAPLTAESYQWSTGSMDKEITIDLPGMYHLSASSECFQYSDSIYIDSFPQPNSVEIFGPDIVSVGQQVNYTSVLSRGMPIEYHWTYEGQDITCTECSSISTAFVSDGTLQLSVIDEEGCTISDQLFVTVEEERSFYAATAFSPNDDGVNDVFYLQSSAAGTVKRLSIYNRWGNQVFDVHNVLLNDREGGWTGIYNSEVLRTGLYIWTAEIEYIDGLIEHQSGSVMLFSK